MTLIDTYKFHSIFFVIEVEGVINKLCLNFNWMHILQFGNKWSMRTNKVKKTPVNKYLASLLSDMP